MTDRAADSRFMRRALALAKRAWGKTTPNPMVGAVIVKDGRIIGEGYHHKAGMPHAEVEAIRSLKDPTAAQGATIYVTLEPCSTFGRTPPCCQAIINGKFARVVIGCPDPNPDHAGRGIKILKDAGIEVVSCVEESACRELNKAFFKWITARKPYVLLKMAQTLDGKIATASGSSQWITGDSAASARVQQLRRLADAVMAGAETLKLDHPRLNARTRSGKIVKNPRRLIATHHPETVPEGYEAVAADTEQDWNELLSRLGKENIVFLLLEGGGELAASALDAGAVDEIEFHIAPKILGGKHSRTSVGGMDPESVNAHFPLDGMTVKKLGRNLRINAFVQKRAK